MMALRLDMYSSTVIRSDDQPLDSPSTSGETHRKSVLLRKKAAKVLSKNFEVLGCWEGRRNPGEGEGKEKNEGVRNGDFRAETGDFRGFPREMACGNRKTSDFFDGKFRGFCHKHPMFYAKKSGVLGVPKGDFRCFHPLAPSIFSDMPQKNVHFHHTAMGKYTRNYQMNLRLQGNLKYTDWGDFNREYEGNEEMWMRIYTDLTDKASKGGITNSDGFKRQPRQHRQLGQLFECGFEPI